MTVTNAGKGSTFLAPEAVTLTLLFDRPGLEEVETGGFDAAETFFGGSSTPALQANLRRANGVRFRKCYLAPGETAKAGPIRIPADGATKVWGSWQAIGAGGFDAARGAIETLDLSLHSLFSILHSPPSRR